MQNPHDIKALAVAIPFFYKPDRLVYLKKACENFTDMADHVQVNVVTNTADPMELEIIRIRLQQYDFDLHIHTPTLLGHPFLLTWSHLDVFRKLHPENAFSHYLYIEDDVYLTVENIRYWLQGAAILKPMRLYPSFVRYEVNESTGVKYLTDVTDRLDLNQLKRVEVGETGYSFVGLPQPYQGMYLLDHAMMKEHLKGPSSNPDFNSPRWPTRERAAQGLTFANVPKGFFSRNLVGCIGDVLDEHALIHHLPNTYVKLPHKLLGKVQYDTLFRPQA